VTWDQSAPYAVAGLALVCVVLVVVLVRLRSGLARTADEVASLRRRLDDLVHDTEAHRTLRHAESQHPASEPPPVEFVITDLGSPAAAAAAEPARLEGPAFADIVLKETVVKAAALAHGIRRGLAPATRNRIRFEMRQEVRRSRKQRRADLKAAQRDLHARQRAVLAEEAS
jgi:hypothetical protein